MSGQPRAGDGKACAVPPGAGRRQAPLHPKGRVKTPGVVLAPAGSTATELIERCGGMTAGHAFNGYLPGGASGGILPASMADIPLDFGTLEKHGCFVGSHAVVILSDKDDMNAAQLMASGKWDQTLLADLAQVMSDASICGLGQAAPNSLKCVIKYLPADLNS